MSSILVIDDDRSVLQTFKHVLADTGMTVLGAGTAAEGLVQLREHSPDVVMLDVMLPDESGLETFQRLVQADPKVPVVFITASNTSDTAIEAMKLGAVDYLIKPLEAEQIRRLVARALEIRRFMHVPVGVISGNGQGSTDSLVGSCPAMQEVYKAIGRVASQNVTVLICGESGTGKELVARAIYQHGPRASGRFLAVNCAAIPEALLESELFGHEKGSFTGAELKRIGKFEQCSGGTLFLDEVGDMSPLVQSKVLRALQEQKFERVGGNETIKTDVRIIAATNRDLEQMVANGTFRADLYYRLNGYTIKLPPLRERTADIPILIEHFLRLFAKELDKSVHDIAPEALDVLLRYRWPGNVRELQSVLKQAILQATGPVVLADFLPAEVRQANSVSGSARTNGQAVQLDSFIEERLHDSKDLYAETLALVERALLTRVLQHTAGNQSHAARILGVTRGCLRNKIRLLRISIDPVISVPDGATDESLEYSLPMSE
ncbi:MAG: sigma-54 dependent transcriptional regulator [Pirellulales bacterium]|nr:sigma-54 dependent transcriptional regulator [Pirellulales bacterium]